MNKSGDYNIKLVDLVPAYGILNHAKRTGRNSPVDLEIRDNHFYNSVYRGLILASYNLALATFVTMKGLETLLQ